MFRPDSLRLPMSEEKQTKKRSPTLLRNYISFAGALIVVAAVVSILLLFFIELTQTAHNPYLGIITYIKPLRLRREREIEKGLKGELPKIP